jgi:hypothetical protein
LVHDPGHFYENASRNDRDHESGRGWPDYIDAGYEFVKETVAHGGTVVFVGTKKQAQEAETRRPPNEIITEGGPDPEMPGR